MKFSKIVHSDKKFVEHVTKYTAHEAINTPDNTLYEISSMSPVATSDNLIVYVDSIRRYEDRDFHIADNRLIKFKYKINDESTVQLIVTEKM